MYYDHLLTIKFRVTLSPFLIVLYWIVVPIVQETKRSRVVINSLTADIILK